MKSCAVALGILSIALMSGAASANPPKHPRPVKLPPGMKVPPDIQAIIDKQNRGDTLSMDDIQKLQAWATGVQNNLPVNGPVNPKDPSKPMGGDTLGIIPGQINGKVTGKYHSVSRDGKAHDEAYDDAMRESLVELLFPWEAHTTKDRTKPDPRPRAQISYKRIVDAIQSGKETPIKVTEHFDWNDHGEQVVGDVDVTITLRPTKAPATYEALLEAVDNWSDWKPEGPTPKNEHGNTFGVRLEIYDHGVPVKKKPTSVVYKLKNVTQLPGVCTNWPQPEMGPARPGTKEDFDLFFAEKNPKGNADKDRQTLELDGDNWSKTVTVESRDFGAYGEVTATITMPGEAPFEAKFSKTKEAFVPLPRDDNHNKIADAWENGRTLDPAADDESKPAMKTTGDGFTVMEEYRGFLVAETRSALPAAGEKHQRLDPDVRELIVLPEVDPTDWPLVKRGIEIFESAIAVKIYTLASGQRTAPHVGDNGRPRGIVFHPTPEGTAAATQSANTVGVWITSHAMRPKAVARAWPASDSANCDADPQACIASPQSLRYVALGTDEESEGHIGWMLTLIDPDAKTGPDGLPGPFTIAESKSIGEYLAGMKVTEAERRRIVAAANHSMATLVREMRGFAIAHELMHVLGAQHHGFPFKDDKENPDVGAPNCPLRYWHNLTAKEYDKDGSFAGWWTSQDNVLQWINFFTRKWNPAETGPSGPWKICDENLPQMGFKP